MIICIDSGNTFVKIAIINDTHYVVKKETVTHAHALTTAQALIKEYAIQQGILCSVTGVDAGMEELFTQSGFMILKHDTPIPLMNAYQSADTLGLDRIAASVAAYDRDSGTHHLVISLGTAIVYNHISDRGIYHGGAISPGIDMRFQALHQYTHALPLVSRDGHLALIGYDTDSSIRSGVIHGATSEVYGMILAYQERFPGIKVTITGGDAPLLEKRIKSGIFADSNLTLQGLKIIYDFNNK